MKPFFNDKTCNCSESILLVDNGLVVSNEDDIATIFNTYFNRITDSLDIPEIPQMPTSSIDPVFTAIEKYSTHPNRVSRASSLSTFNSERKERKKKWSWDRVCYSSAYSGNQSQL